MPISGIVKGRQIRLLPALYVAFAASQELTMSDNLNHAGEPDRSRINTNQEHEVQYWSKKFGCTADQLRKAVGRVGNKPEAVESELKYKATSH